MKRPGPGTERLLLGDYNQHRGLCQFRRSRWHSATCILLPRIETRLQETGPVLLTALLHMTVADNRWQWQAGKLHSICIYTCCGKHALVYVNWWHMISHWNSKFHMMSSQSKISDQKFCYAWYSQKFLRMVSGVPQQFTTVLFLP